MEVEAMSLWRRTVANYEGKYNALNGLPSLLWWETKVRKIMACKKSSAPGVAVRCVSTSVCVQFKTFVYIKECL